jgi:hypothetical protein
MKIADWVYRRLFDVAGKVQQWALVRHYGINAPAPPDWRVREGLPLHDRWPKHSDGLTSALVVGAQKVGRVKPVRAETFPAVGGQLAPVDEESVSK